MAAQIGDIVSLNGERWVVAEFEQNAQGTQDARIIRTLSWSEGRQRSFLKNAAFLTVVETPVFEIGERVRILGDNGTVQSTDADGIHINVLMDERERELTRDHAAGKRGPKIAMEPSVTRIENWKLTLENRGV